MDLACLPMIRGGFEVPPIAKQLFLSFLSNAMKITPTIFSVLTMLIAWASQATAADDPLEFIHLMQREGFADVAIDYLDQIKTDNAPKEVMDVWDLEMSRSKRAAAKSSRNEEKMIEESKALLEKFIRENPDRTEAIQEAAKWLEEKATEAQYDVQKAAFTTDPAEKAKLLAAARKIFEEIKPKFVDALKASVKVRDALPTKVARAQAAKLQERRENAIMMVGENRVTVAMIDFYLAYTQEEGSERTAALTKCAKEFDSIYQDFRDLFLGWKAHFWHGRIMQVLGQTEEARDIFEEVAAHDAKNIEDTGDQGRAGTRAKPKPTGLEGFFADVEQYYLQTLFKLNKKDYMEEVQSWRRDHKQLSEFCTGYQALTMDYVKICLDYDKQTKNPAYKKAAIKLLGEMSKIPSPYQEGAIKLRRELNPNATAEESFDDDVVDGDAALEKQKWAEAVESYEKALSAAGPKTDPKSIAAVREAIVGCNYRLAAQLYKQGKIPEAIATAKKALRPDLLQTKAAPLLATFLLNVVVYQYQSAPEDSAEQKAAKEELRSTLMKTASAIIKFWPAREEADVARVALMRIAQAEGRTAEADKILREINPESKEYPNALSEIGASHWIKYRAAKKKTDATKEEIAKRDEDRKLAVDFLEKAIQAMAKLRLADAPMSDSLRKAQMLLAEIYSEGGDFKQAASLYKPLIDDIAKDKDTSRPFDDTALRIFYGAGPAFLKLGDMDNVVLLGTKFVALGTDQPLINDSIYGFAISLEQARKNALAEGESTDPAVQSAAAAKVKTLMDLEEKILVALTKREKLSYRTMASIVRSSSDLGTEGGNAAAADLIEKIFQNANNDPAFEKAMGKGAVGLHALGARLQAENGNYEKAIPQIQAVLLQYPRVPDFLISEARIYTAWGSKDPTKFSDAIAKWDNLRKMLERAKSPAGKQVNPKYEVIYNEADCFYRMWQKNKSKDDAKKGLDLVLPYLNLDPNIRTPDDDYKEISVKFYQVGGKLADALSYQRPARPKIKPAPKK
jgi:hypothetical protein